MENNRIFEPYWNKQSILFPVRPSKIYRGKRKLILHCPISIVSVVYWTLSNSENSATGGIRDKYTPHFSLKSY